jgi:hypothetical protein
LKLIIFIPLKIDLIYVSHMNLADHNTYIITAYSVALGIIFLLVLTYILGYLKAKKLYKKVISSKNDEQAEIQPESQTQTLD